MSETKKECCEGGCCKGGMGKGVNAQSGAVYCMGFLGAAYYFIIHAASFGAGVVGVIKAIFWPAVLIFKVLEFLKM